MMAPFRQPSAAASRWIILPAEGSRRGVLPAGEGKHAGIVIGERVCRVQAQESG
jgi:hypothetical protein